MDPGQIQFGIFDLVGVIMLVLAGTSFIYLLRVGNKSRSTWMLLWFFMCVILSSIATIVTNIGTAWDWAFAPSQDAFLILGGVFLVRFAYLYPTMDQPREARWVAIFFSILASVALIYAFSFAIWFFANLPADHRDNQLYYLLTPIAISLAIFVFFRRSIHFSFQTLVSSETVSHRNKSAIKYLFKPNNRSSSALRNYGLSLAISLVPALALIEWIALPQLVASFLFNFGAVAAISVLMLTYLNYAPESVSVSAKLVGISLVSVLLIMGFAGVTLYHTNPGLDEHSLVSTFITLVLISSILIILTFPLFFRTALLDPLARLLRGVKTANDGDLNVQVPVQYADEIGFLTQSFNRMISALNEATQALRYESTILEKQVAERTAELREINQELISENIERRSAETRLDRQLHYEQALAGCSQALLIVVEDEASRQHTLNQALDFLLIGAQASRAYIFRNLHDPELGDCIGILAEACAPGIKPQINNPVNQRFPWSQLPVDMFDTLNAGRPFGGPVEQSFARQPQLLKAFLHQAHPLLSVQCFPIFLNNQWWGFVGFDDCQTPRQWDELEIRMLRTASEMIGNTVQRWQAEERLHQTLNTLEQRVQERTIEFAQANAELKHEIHVRQRFQNELEERLDIEKAQASISARLLSPMDLKPAIRETLADLGRIMQASRITFIRLPSDSIDHTGEMIEWHTPDTTPIFNDQERLLNSTYSWFRDRLAGSKSVYLPDLAALPSEALPERALFMEGEAGSLLMVPLIMENYLAGVIAFSNPNHQKARTPENVQAIEVVASMLSSLLTREELLNTLEEKVAERTRELFAFFDLVMLAGETQEIADILQSALVKIIEMSASEAAFIHLYDGDRHTLNLVAQRGFPTDYHFNLRTIHLSESVMNWVEDTGSGEDSESSITIRLPDEFVFPGYFLAYHIPLRARGKLQGFLSCYRLAEMPFDPYQSTFLSAIGEQLGMAIENYRLRLKAEEIATIQERQRLARELHDAVSQSLYSLTLFARSGRDALEVGDQIKLLDSLEQLEVNSLAALKEMRLLLYQLRALALEEGGLLAAIETRFNLVERRSDIQATIDKDDRIELTGQIEQELYRLVTEALNNSLKYAGASQVSVTIQADDSLVVLDIRDNGGGFDPDRAYPGMGLHNMRDRVSALCGRFELDSQPGSGTRIHVEIPQFDVPSGEA